MNYLLNLDYKVFLWLNNFADKSEFFDKLVIFFGHTSVYVLVLVFLVYWFVTKDKIKVRTMIWSGVVSFILSRLVFVEIIRIFISRQRPFVDYQVMQLIVKDAEKSFPSGHSASLFAIALAIYFYNKKLGYGMFVLAFLASFSRVIGGIHYFGDILGGAIIGLLAGWIIKKYYTKVLLHGQKLSEICDRILSFTTR